MSRIGKLPVTVPEKVDVKISENNTAVVEGPKGKLTQSFDSSMTFEREGNVITVKRSSDAKNVRALHGLTRSLLNNMVKGVSEGFERRLEVVGVGYRAQLQGKKLILNLGYSHPVEMEQIEGIKIEVPSPNLVVISGADKQIVGQFAANVRGKRPPEPYHGKGIRYQGEFVRILPGKAGGKKK